MTTQDQLVKFEKYIRRQSFSYRVKQNMLFQFHSVFWEEMKGTKTGDKFRKKVLEDS